MTTLNIEHWQNVLVKKNLKGLKNFLRMTGTALPPPPISLSKDIRRRSKSAFRIFFLKFDNIFLLFFSGSLPLDTNCYNDPLQENFTTNRYNTQKLKWNVTRKKERVNQQKKKKKKESHPTAVYCRTLSAKPTKTWKKVTS